MPDNSEAQILIDRVETTRCGHCGHVLTVADMEPFTGVECPGCGNLETVPARFNQFLLLNLINTGGMGAVYLAKDESLGRRVAIKVMLSSLGNNQEFVENFKREAQAAAQLNHPNVAQIYSFGQEKGQPYIVMEFVAGQRFDKIIARGKALDQAFVLKIGMDIAEGLKAADGIGLVHGDVKPENILLDEKRNAKLVDFGIAGVAGQAAAEGVWGTPYYIAPEKIRQQKLDARSDIYSLGATLFHALAGIPPFEGETPVEVVRARLEQPAPPLSEVRPETNDILDATVARMLELEPARRYPTYASLISDMRKAFEAVKKKGGHGADEVGTGKKLILKKSTSRVSSGKRGHSSIVIRGHGGGARALREPSEAEHRADEARRRRNSAVALGVTALFVLLLGGGILGLYLIEKRRDEIEQRRRWYALKEKKTGVETIFGSIQRAATNGIELAEGIHSLVEQATNAVFLVLGTSIERDVAITPAPKEPQPKEPQPEEIAEKAAPAAVTKKSTQDSEDRAAPFGMPSRAEFTRQLEMRQGKSPAPPADDTAPAERSIAPMEPRETAKEEELVVLAHEILAEAATIQETVDGITSRVATARRIKKAALETSDVGNVSEKAGELTRQLTAIKLLVADIETSLETAKQSAADVETKKQEFEEEQAAIKEEQDRKRREEQKEAMIKAELERAGAVHDEILPLIGRFRYDEAEEALKYRQAEYQTDEGKKELKVLIDRLALLRDLQELVIERLNSRPFRAGWDNGRGAREDIVSAGKQGIKLKHRWIPWERIPPTRFLRIARHCLAGRDVPPNKKGRCYLGAAVFCHENDATEASIAYIEKAVEAAPYLREEADRLLPQE